MIDTFHERTHEGVAYTVTARDLALIDDGILDMLIVVNSAKTIHARMEASAGADAILDLYENPFTDAASLGTAITPRNRARWLAAPDVADSNFYKNPFTNAASLGTSLGGDFAAGGAAKTAGGGSGGSAFMEWNLPKGSTYLFRLINKSGLTKIANLKTNFYERD